MMHNPPHPGEFIKATYMQSFGLICRYLASHLDVSPSTLNRLLKQQSSMSPEMALRLSKALGRGPESWLAMQNVYDLWIAAKNVKLDKVQKSSWTRLNKLNTLKIQMYKSEHIYFRPSENSSIVNPNPKLNLLSQSPFVGEICGAQAEFYSSY